MKIQKTGYTYTEDTYEEVKSLSIDNNLIKGTVYQDTEHKVIRYWYLDGRSIYPQYPDLNMLNIKIEEEIE